MSVAPHDLARLPFNIFGSQSSRDCDVLVLIAGDAGSPDFRPPTRLEACTLCVQLRKYLTECHTIPTNKPINVNLAVLDHATGMIGWVHNGLPDSCTNAVRSTYALHTPLQVHPLFVTAEAQRDVPKKFVNALRSILSTLTRTNLRRDVRHALNQVNHVAARAALLRKVQLETVVFDEKHRTCVDACKIIAFEIGQCLSLVADPQVELYTKESIAEQHPQLECFLKREFDPVSALPVLTYNMQLFLDQVDILVQRNPAFAEEIEELNK